MKGLYPYEKYALSILGLTLAWLGLHLPQKASLAPLFIGHLALLLAYLGLLFFLRRRSQDRLTGAWRGLFAVIGIIGVLFVSLGKVGFAAMDWNADAWLEAVDRILCGGQSPSLWLERWTGYGWIEFLSFIYGIFIPYMYLSVFLSLFGRPLSESSSFLNGFVLLYALGYLGYLFMPATGPVDFLAPQFQHALHGGPQYQRMMDGVRLTGIDHGAFPSLHVGASVYLCLFEWRHNRLRGIAYLPLAILITISTLFLRWHYLIDVLVGAGMAVALCPKGLALAWPPKQTALDPALIFLRGGGHEPLPLDWPPELSPRFKGLEARVERWRQSRVAADRKAWAALQDFLAGMQKAGIAPGDLYLPIRPGKALLFALRELEILVVGLPLALLGSLGFGLKPFSGAYRVRVLAIFSRCRSFLRLALEPALRQRLQSEGRAWIRNLSQRARA